MVQQYTMADLADASGVPARRIRYYVAQNLIPGPQPMGPNARYSESHLQQLKSIQELQAQGLTLDEIRVTLLGMGTQIESGPIMWCQHFEPLPGVQLIVQADAIPRWKRTISRVLDVFARANIIDGPNNVDEGD